MRKWALKHDAMIVQGTDEMREVKSIQLRRQCHNEWKTIKCMSIVSPLCQFPNQHLIRYIYHSNS